MHADGALGAGLVRFLFAGRQAHCKRIWATLRYSTFNGHSVKIWNATTGELVRLPVGWSDLLLLWMPKQGLTKERG